MADLREAKGLGPLDFAILIRNLPNVPLEEMDFLDPPLIVIQTKRK